MSDSRPKGFDFGARWREPFGPGGWVYMRHSARVSPLPTGQRSLRCIDVADVALPEGTRGRGTFTAWLGELEAYLAASPFLDAICVDNVTNTRLAAFLHRRGYTSNGLDALPSFFRVKQR